MARTIKEEEYNAKRNEILDFALSLVYSKGYTLMTIQDILDGLKISRGALYHYFDSKQAILEALIDRMEDEAEQILLPIVHDPNLSAIQKINRYFELSSGWKNMKKDFIISFLRIWYTDENALIRQKMASDSMRRTANLIEPIIRQGIEEKVFTTKFPEQAAKIFIGLALSLTDSIFEPVNSQKPGQDGFEKLVIIMDAYADSIERILGAPSGSLKILEKDVFKDWLDEIQPEPEMK